MNNGWIKIHREIKDKGYYKNSMYVHLWVHLLLLVNHSKTEFLWNNKIMIVKEGQFITGRKQLSEATGIPESTVERILKCFEKDGQIGQQKTTKYRLITIINWGKWQKVDNKWTTSGQQMDTNNKGKNDKNIVDTTIIGTDKPVQTEVVTIIGLFKNINPAYKKWYGNKTQRSAIDSLIKSHGIDKVRRVISILPKTNQMSWITTITTPQQLEDRWATLEAQLIKEKNKNNSNKRKIL